MSLPVALPIMAGVAVASAAVSTYGNIKANQAERQALKDKQAASLAAAAESKRRAALNMELLQRKSSIAFGEALNVASIQSGDTSAMRHNLELDLSKEMERAQTEADYEYNSRIMEANIYGSQASERNKLTPYLAVGGALSAAKDAYSIFR